MNCPIGRGEIPRIPPLEENEHFCDGIADGTCGRDGLDIVGEHVGDEEADGATEGACEAVEKALYDFALAVVLELFLGALEDSSADLGDAKACTGREG